MFFCASSAPMNSLAVRVELAAADVEPRGQHRHLVLRALHGGVRLHLDDFLLRLGELRLRLLERVLLIGRIELDDDIAGLDRHPGLHERDDAQHAADRRRHHGHRSSRRAARRSRGP